MRWLLVGTSRPPALNLRTLPAAPFLQPFPRLLAQMSHLSPFALHSSFGHLVTRFLLSAIGFLLTTSQWACVDSNHGPLRYQHSALTV